MKNKKHLLLLSPGFPESEADTRCIPALQLFVEELNKRELFEITVISFHYPYIETNNQWKGVNVYALGGDNRTGIHRLFILRRAIKLAKLLNKQNPFDFIHSFWLGECAWVGNRLAKRLSVPHSCTLMGQDVLKENPYLSRVKPLPKLITLSKFHEQKLLESSGIKSERIINWGIEENAKPVKQEKEIDLIAVGNLTELKNHSLFLELVFELKKEFPSIRAEIVGEGEKQVSLKQKIKNLKLQKNVELSGVLNREDTLQKISKAKCLVHTSGFESFGMVLIEGLLLGTKVFSTPVGIALEENEIDTFETKKEAVQKLTQYLKSNEVQQQKTPMAIAKTVNEYLTYIFI